MRSRWRWEKRRIIGSEIFMIKGRIFTIPVPASKITKIWGVSMRTEAVLPPNFKKILEATG